MISRRAWETLLVSSVAIFLAGMDVTIVGVALPDISQSFIGVEPSVLAWLFTGYSITFAALLLLGARLGDRIGYRTAFLAGAATFGVASLLAAAAPSIAVLIAARVLQGAGSAVIYPASLALLLQSFPIQRRSLALGVWGAMAGLGSIIAPTLGALLVEWAGWRAVFLVNVPFVLAAAIRGLDGPRGPRAARWARPLRSGRRATRRVCRSPCSCWASCRQHHGDGTTPAPSPASSSAPS